MALDLAGTVHQLDALAQRVKADRDDRGERLYHAVEAMRRVDPAEARRKADSNQGRPYLCAGLVDGLADRYLPPEAPQDFCVASVDGSHIDVDRHLPLRCYLINLGGCVLTYGSQPDATLFSRPTLYSDDGDLYLTSSTAGSRETVPVEGAVLGLRRTVEEVKALALAVKEAPPGMPVLALIDGSLVLWGLAGRGYPPFVREEILNSGLIPALDALWEPGRDRTVGVAAYTSLPQGPQVVNTLRMCLCPYDAPECTQHCSSHRSGKSPCDLLNGFMDRHLFGELLEPGERSSTFKSSSSVSTDYYGRHEVYFYYLNNGEEIARVEVPEWVAMDEGLLALTHGLILDQCRRGRGYPAAIIEAHEQAVVTGADRESFRGLLEESLTRNRLPVYTSEKNRSKRMRWL